MVSSTCHGRASVGFTSSGRTGLQARKRPVTPAAARNDREHQQAQTLQMSAAVGAAALLLVRDKHLLELVSPDWY